MKLKRFYISKRGIDLFFYRIFFIIQNNNLPKPYPVSNAEKELDKKLPIFGIQRIWNKTYKKYFIAVWIFRIGFYCNIGDYYYKGRLLTTRPKEMYKPIKPKPKIIWL